VLIAAGFDGFVERQCAKDYAPRRGRPSLPPGRYFRMLLIGYFEGIDSERGLEWRCTDSLSLREFLRLSEREGVPDHSWLSRTRSRLPLEVHDQVFTWVLERLAAHGLIKGERIGVDASTMEANAALRTIVRRDSGEGYREMLTRMARESGIETPTAEDLVRLDRNRKGKKLSGLWSTGQNHCAEGLAHMNRTRRGRRARPHVRCCQACGCRQSCHAAASGGRQQNEATRSLRAQSAPFGLAMRERSHGPWLARYTSGTTSPPSR
jgi:transposase